MQKTYRPLFKRYIVFSVPLRRKSESSNLFLGNCRRGAYSRAEDVWVISMSNHCQLELQQGDHCFVSDSFELEPTDLDLWDDYKHLDAFKSLREFVEQVDGDVVTKLVHQDSILAVDNDLEARPVLKSVI